MIEWLKTLICGRELAAARLEAEKRELVYQLDGVRKQVRALRKRSRRG